MLEENKKYRIKELHPENAWLVEPTHFEIFKLGRIIESFQICWDIDNNRPWKFLEVTFEPVEEDSEEVWKETLNKSFVIGRAILEEVE